MKLFNDFDVKETSHHLVISHLDLHICDDIHAKEKESNRRVSGGAMQLSFTQLTIDYYPYHKAGVYNNLFKICKSCFSNDIANYFFQI